ncbi:MAG: Bug family tripartite tricarboxylate transporter substrate binding protein [Xanthobacteraceae bacterium]
MAVAWLLAGGAALAQSGDAAWPDRPLKLIVPFPAGSSTDIIARLLGQRLATKLGQQVVIENRVGASGSIGADAVAKAAPDGYTLGIATASTHALAMSLNTNLPYDPVKDFAPVGMIGGQPYVLVIYPGLGPKTLGELIALAKTKPGTLNYGSAGVASLAHLAAALFANQAGISLTHVPYKSSAQSVTDMIAGRLDMQFATIAPTLANIRDGKLRALATSGAKRSAALPDVPTVAESGLPGYEAVLWVAMVTPAGTPTAITTRLNRELNDILKAADTREALAAQGVEAEPGTPDAVTQRIKTDIDKWRGVVAKSGIKR